MDAPNRGLPIVIGVGIVVITAVLAKIFLFGNKKKKAPITLQDPNLELHDATDLSSQLAASEEKATKLAAELQVTKQHEEERRKQSNKLQRRFDSELSKVQEEMKTEKSDRERLEREKDELLHDAIDLKSQLSASEERATRLDAVLQVTKQHVEERRTQSNKLQRRLDSDLSKIQEGSRTEKREKYELGSKILILEKNVTVNTNKEGGMITHFNNPAKTIPTTGQAEINPAGNDRSTEDIDEDDDGGPEIAEMLPGIFNQRRAESLSTGSLKKLSSTVAGDLVENQKENNLETNSFNLP